MDASATEREPIDPVPSVDYGLLVQSAYDTYDADPDNLNPTPKNLPEDYHLLLTVQMTDFFFLENQRQFYGFFAFKKTDPGLFVLALRGTRTLKEWWADLHDWPVKCPFSSDAGYVVAGFLDLYQTLGVMFPNKEDSHSLTDPFPCYRVYHRQILD